MRRLSLTALCALALLACIGAAQADTTSADAAPAETTEFKPKVVAVFKNGLGFFIRTGEATINDGWGVTKFVPQALMGTFWMSTVAPDRYVQEIVAYNESIEDHPKCRTVEELLRANVGKRIRIGPGNHAGALEEILENRLI